MVKKKGNFNSRNKDKDHERNHDTRKQSIASVKSKHHIISINAIKIL